jgi:hypothetical protein
MAGSTGIRDTEIITRLGEGAASTRAERNSDEIAPASAPAWADLPMNLLERLPLPYIVVAAVVGMSAVAEQVFELALEGASFSSLTLSTAGPALVLPALMIYILTHLRILKKAAVKALVELRPSVQVSDEVYNRHAQRLIQADWRAEVVLMAVSLGVVLLMFLGLKTELLSTASHLPGSLLPALFVIANYTVLGWLLLSLVYCGIRQSRALRDLAREPLVVNVFDPINLVPFGRLSLLQSLPTVGIVLIPLVLIGPPTQAGFLVIALSLVSVLSLFVPLWGVHQQIDGAKEAVLENIHNRLLAIQRQLLTADDLDAQTIDNMADRTNMLAKMRDLIQQSPNWPFKDSAAVARAIVAVSSPIVYYILNELIRAYVIPFMTGGTP